MYPQIRSMNYLQIKSLISIRQNQFTIKIIENTFTRNSAIKGLVYIENLKEQTTFKNYVAIYGNIFDATATFFGTSAIFIRSEANQTLFPYRIDQYQTYCMGITIDSNIFTYSFGCPKYGGSLVSIQCSENIASITEDKESNYDKVSINTEYDESQNSTFFNYPHYIVSNDIADSFVSPSNQEIQVLRYKSVFKNNTLFRNFGGFGEGLINIVGFLRFYLINNTFIGNGENMIELTNYLNTLHNRFL